MEKNMRVIGIAVLMLLLSGCAGVMTVHNPDTEIKDLNFKLASKGFLNTDATENSNYTKKSVLEIWGKPDSIKVNGAKEQWKYNQTGLAWAGLIPVIIVPIPLLVPVGKNGVVLVFQDELLISAIKNQREGNIAMCGYFLMDDSSGSKGFCFSDFADNEK